VPFRDSYIDAEGNLNIVMGYCEGGDLHNLIEEAEGKKFEEKKIVDWVVQIALSILYLHQRKTLHRDIKTQNIFLTNNMVMLGDFGVSKVLDHATDLTRTNIGTPYYMSPEQYRQKPYNYKSYVWYHSGIFGHLDASFMRCATTSTCLRRCR
jgi:non-specific serine/threonine protein kinase/NIMA (never in mitosis gene a)-related kinase